MKKVCWAVEWKGKLVKSSDKFGEPVQTALFRSRKHAEAWLEDNRYWARLKAHVIRVKVTITEF